MFSSLVHPGSRNSQQNYVPQVPRGFTMNVFKAPTLAGFPYTGYQNPEWYYTRPETNIKGYSNGCRDVAKPNSRFRASGSFTVYPNAQTEAYMYDHGFYPSPDTNSTTTSSMFSPTTTDSTVTTVPEDLSRRSRPATPAPAAYSMSRSQSRGTQNSITQSANRSSFMAPTSSAVVHLPNSEQSVSYDSQYLIDTPATVGSEDIDYDIDRLARINTELNSNSSYRESIILSDSSNGMLYFPTLPLSSSPEQMTAEASYEQMPESPYPQNTALGEEDQFLPPLEWDTLPRQTDQSWQAVSSAERRQSYAAVAASDTRPLPTPPSLSRTPSVSTSFPNQDSRRLSVVNTSLSQYAFPSTDESRSTKPNEPLATPRPRRVSAASSTGQSFQYQPQQSQSQLNRHVSFSRVTENPTNVRSSAGNVKSTPNDSQYRARKVSVSGPAPPSIPSRCTTPRNSETGTAPRMAFPTEPQRRNSDLDPGFSRPVSQAQQYPDKMSASWPQANNDIPPPPEPQRRHSDGDQYPLRGRGVSVAARNVRWNENLICPSPVFANQRRKGWFNRRGDQLWTNGGTYMPAPAGKEFPPDLDSYPEYGQGWMNEGGVRIDMMHRLIPKAPLRSALKQSSKP